MKKVVSVILGLFLAFSLCVFPEVQTANALSTAPSAVCMSYYSDIYSRGFAWQTTTDISETKLMLVKDNGSTPDWQNAEVIEGTRKDFLNYRYHKAQVENLTPGAKYYYRVGGNGVYSDIGSFTVEQSEVKDVSFVYVTDSQEESREGFEQWNKTLKSAMQTVDADFITFLGDLVNNSHANWGSDFSKIEMEEWTYAYDAPKEILMRTPLMAVAGNHECAGETFIDHNNIKFAGASATGGYYSFDYGDLHVVGLNGNEAGNPSLYAAQLEWLKNDLASTDKKWKVVMSHQGVYSTGDHSNDGECLYLRSVLPQVMAEYEVDLFLQGHDHVYCRTLPYFYGEGENGRIPNRSEKLVEVTEGEESLYYSMEPDGTYYVTINYAGTKSYPPVEYDTGRIFPAKSPVNGDITSQQIRNRMFATVEIEGDELVFKAYIAYEDGSTKLHDYFAVRKNTYQNAASLIESLPESTQADARCAETLYQAKTEVEALSDRALKRLGEEKINKLNEILSVLNVQDALMASGVISQVDALLAKTEYNAQFWADYAAAKNAYYNLSADQMALVVNSNELLTLDESLIESFAIRQVQALVDAIKSAKNKAEAVLVANEAYMLLSENAKSKITDTELLSLDVAQKSGALTTILIVAGVAVVLLGAVAVFFTVRKKHEKS